MKNYKNNTYIILLLISCALISCKQNQSKANDDSVENTEKISTKDTIWEQADKIIAEITIPEFQDKEFNIKDYGAVSDGNTNNSEAFKEAIAACNEAGGGKVIVPKGKFLTGPIHLKSNVNLHLAEGAEVLFCVRLGRGEPDETLGGAHRGAARGRPRFGGA